MVRRTTHFVLVILAVLVATGPSALVVADTGGATTAAADSGAVDAIGPLDAPDDLSDETTDANVTDENLTEDTDENTTDGGTVENETVDDGTTDATETLTNETVTNETTIVETSTVETTTNASDGATTDLDADGTDATTEAADSWTTTESESLASNATNEVENATSATDGTKTDGTNTADVTETIDDATSGATDTSPEYASFDAMAPSSPRVDAANIGDASLEDREVDVALGDEGFDPRTPDDSGPTTDRERRAEKETTAAGVGDDGVTGDNSGTDDDGAMGGNTGGGDAGGNDAGADDAKSSGGGADSDGLTDRDLPGAPPSGTDAVVGAGALAAVALFPHLADGLPLASDAGALSAASSTVTRSQATLSFRGEFDKVWRTATAFRYSRYDDSDPLAHETRATLHETVEHSPGAYLSQVCERADVAVSTARHHLDVLEDEGLVTTAKVRGKRRYFPAHSDDVELAAALEDEGAAEVLRALACLGDSHGGRLADELDRDPSTVSHHLARLEDAGLVEREREGRAVVNRLAPGVERVLDEGRDEADEEIAGDGEADAESPAIAD